MNFKTSVVKGVTVIELSGNVMGGPDAAALNDQLHKLVEADRKSVIIDLHGVKFVNSSGLGMLIGGLTTMRNAGGQMRLARPSKKIEDLIAVTRLDKVFDLHKTVASAVASLKG